MDPIVFLSKYRSKDFQITDFEKKKNVNAIKVLLQPRYGSTFDFFFLPKEAQFILLKNQNTGIFVFRTTVFKYSYQISDLTWTSSLKRKFQSLQNFPRRFKKIELNINIMVVRVTDFDFLIHATMCFTRRCYLAGREYTCCAAIHQQYPTTHTGYHITQKYHEQRMEFIQT